MVKLVYTHASGACAARHVGSSPTVGTMGLKELFPVSEKPVNEGGNIIDLGAFERVLTKEEPDPMRQAFDELFNPLLNGKPIFIEVNSRAPSVDVGPFFINLQRWGAFNSLATVSIDFGYSPARTPEKTHELFVRELKNFKRQADKQPMLVLIRRFNFLKRENYGTYKDLFLKLVSARKPVGIIIQTVGSPRFITSTELTELGEALPRVVDIDKVISPRNSSYISR